MLRNVKHCVSGQIATLALTTAQAIDTPSVPRYHPLMTRNERKEIISNALGKAFSRGKSWEEIGKEADIPSQSVRTFVSSGSL